MPNRTVFEAEYKNHIERSIAHLYNTSVTLLWTPEEKIVQYFKEITPKYIFSEEIKKRKGEIQ